MAQHGLLIDYEFCTGCHACEMACKVEKGLGEGEWGIKLAQIGPWKLDGDAWEWDYVPLPTQRCDLCAERVAAGMAWSLPELGKKLRGFDLPDAVLTGPETRSSSPVRLLRGQDFQSPGLPGLYPCGEGAGYAGGITSAAADGLRCAEALIGAS